MAVGGGGAVEVDLDSMFVVRETEHVFFHNDAGIHVFCNSKDDLAEAALFEGVEGTFFDKVVNEQRFCWYAGMLDVDHLNFQTCYVMIGECIIWKQVTKVADLVDRS